MPVICRTLPEGWESNPFIWDGNTIRGFKPNVANYRKKYIHIKSGARIAYDTDITLGNQYLKEFVADDGVTVTQSYIRFNNSANVEKIQLGSGFTIGPQCNNCSSLKSVTLSDAVTYLESFKNCSSLTDIIIPPNVTTLASGCFSGCTSLVSIHIPDSVTNGLDGAFDGCTKLADVTLSRNMPYISSYAFNGCSALKHISLPSGITSIGRSAFSWCGLEEITIPDSVTTIGASAFTRCNYLKEIIIPDSVTSIGEKCFDNSGYYNLTKIIIGNGITSIPKYAFPFSLAQEMTIKFPSGLTSMDSGLLTLFTVYDTDGVTMLPKGDMTTFAGNTFKKIANEYKLVKQ